jgi:hypothetical protein
VAQSLQAGDRTVLLVFAIGTASVAIVLSKGTFLALDDAHREPGLQRTVAIAVAFVALANYLALAAGVFTCLFDRGESLALDRRLSLVSLCLLTLGAVWILVCRIRARRSVVEDVRRYWVRYAWVTAGITAMAFVWPMFLVSVR